MSEETFAGFNLDEQLHEIRLGGKQSGNTFQVLHVLKDPTAKQWKEYQGATSHLKAKRGEPEYQDRTLSAREKLWNLIAVRVEGYFTGGRALECDGEDWKRHIPILHKSEAIRQLGNVWNEDDELEKNSETASED